MKMKALGECASAWLKYSRASSAAEHPSYVPGDAEGSWAAPYKTKEASTVQYAHCSLNIYPQEWKETVTSG